MHDNKSTDTCGFRSDRRAVEGLPTRELQCGKTQCDALNESAFTTSHVGPIDNTTAALWRFVDLAYQLSAMANLEIEE